MYRLTGKGKTTRCIHAQVSSAIDFSTDFPTVFLLANKSISSDAWDLNYVFPSSIKYKCFLWQNNGKKEHIFQLSIINIPKNFRMDIWCAALPIPIHIDTHACVHVCKRMYICIYIYKCVGIEKTVVRYLRIVIHMQVYTCVCIYICKSIYIHKHTYIVSSFPWWRIFIKILQMKCLKNCITEHGGVQGLLIDYLNYWLADRRRFYSKCTFGVTPMQSTTFNNQYFL